MRASLPYLLRNPAITHVNQVWSADITYVPMPRGFIYLVAVIDWHSRYVLAWQLSNTLDGEFCLDTLRQALTKGRPTIFNTDQGARRHPSISATQVICKLRLDFKTSPIRAWNGRFPACSCTM